MSEEKKSNFLLTFSVLDKMVVSPRDHYLDPDWQTITLAPLWVFDAVAKTGRDPDDKERAAFEATVSKQPPGIFTAFVFAHVRKHLSELAVARDAAGREPLEALADVDTLLRNYPRQNDAEEFRRDLIALATTVAGASGGVLGLGSKISEREAAAIEQLRAVLRVPAS